MFSEEIMAANIRRLPAWYDFGLGGIVPMSLSHPRTRAKIVNLLVYLIRELVLGKWRPVVGVAVIIIGGGAGDRQLPPLSSGCRHGHCWDRWWVVATVVVAGTVGGR